MELASKLFGKGLQVDRQRSKRSLPVYVPPTNTKKGGLVVPYQNPPPFFGTWENLTDMGVKNKPLKKRKQKKQIASGLLLGKTVLSMELQYYM